MKRKLLHFLSLLIMMIVSTSAWAETVVLSAPSQSVKSHSDADEIIKITDDSNQEGIQVGSGTFSYNGSSYTPMKLSGSRQFNLTYSNDVTINSVKIICTDNKNDQKEYHLGVSSSDRTSIGTFAVKGATPSEFTITDKTGLNADAQFLAIIVVDYTPSSTKTETGIAATGIKVNGAKVDGASFGTDNTYTLEGSYILPPTVAVIKTTSYSDSSTKNADVTVTLALNEDKSFHIGKVTIGETEYTIKVPVKALSTTLADVTGSTTWDWTKTGATAIQLSDETYPSKTDEFVLSNLIPSTDNFNSDALKVQTEYAVRDGKYFQGGKIMFHTTVPGTIKVTFSNTGNRSNDDEIRYLYVNGTKTEFGSKVSNANAETDNIAVPAGDVVLTAQMPKQPDVDQYIRLFSIVFTATTGETYAITYNNNGHGTAPTNVESATALPAELPTMTEEGWTFDGWFTNEGLTDAAVAGATLTANTTLYAKWTQNAGPEPTEWESYELVLNAAGLLTTEDMTKVDNAYPSIIFGIALDAEGKAYRVAPDATNAIAVVSGKYHSDHGMNPFSMTAKVPGAVKITAGTCSFGTCQVKVNGNAAGEAVVGDGSTTCWKGNKDNIATGIYTGEAGEITITTGCYTPYIKIEKWNASIHTVTFAKGEVECEGTLLPEAKEVADGENMTIPANHTLYKEGYTLTGWTDGTNIYNVGTSFAPTAETTLTPVFTENTKSLADRTGDVTVKWDFQTQNGAPTLSYEGKEGLIYVTQATVEEQTIDVKLDFSTKPGKVNNASWNDWCQMNSGTTFTIPSCKGAKVSIASMNATTTSTIDGQTDYTAAGGVVTAEIGNKADAIDIVIGDGSYFRYIQVVLPVVEAAGGKTYTNEPANVTWNFNNATTYATANSITPTDGFSLTTFNLNKASVEGTGTSVHANGVTFVSIKPAIGADDTIEWSVKPKKGLTFTPTKVSGYITRNGTDKENGVTITGKAGSETIKLGNYTAPRSNKNVDDDKYSSNSNYTSKFEITLTNDQQTKLSSTEGFSLTSTIGVGTGNPSAGFSGIVIEGILNGTIQEVTTYSVDIIAAPENGGSVSKYPNAETYEEGDEITLTATENFGYDFVNWTNAAGEEVSTETKFKAEVTANETYTANFVKVDTYELAVTMDGGANPYMISYNPAPTMVDEKMMYEAGTKVTLTASDNTVLTFNNWSNGETNKETVVTMDDNVNIQVNYSAIDFIVGWDFYQTGGRTRVADFIGNTENEAATMDMIDASGTSKGFYLRPYNNSYEGKTCALNWNALAEKYYFQTMINTNEFSNIKVQSQMLYNYNAWTVQKLEASLDGETWETITSQDLGGTKNWQAVNGTLPAKYEHQPKVYLRWIPDYTSTVKGTTSDNDGTCLTNVYVIADKKLVDDGVAPVLVSTVPAQGANNASANGKIVLTFDEKVKVAEGAVATLGTMSLTPVVSGKTVSFEYKSLEYSTPYTFSLPANSVADLTDNYMAEAITINFQTKVKPAIEKGLYDVIVSNGEELAAAIKAANSRADQNARFRIFVKKGAHVLPTNGGKTTGGDGKEYDDPRTTMTASNVSIIGEDFETTSFTNITPAATWDNGFGSACPLEGIGNGDVLINKGTSNYFQGVTIKTSMGDAHGRDIAFNDQGNKTIFKNARLWGYQDTYVSNSNKSRYYFENGVIRGRTDYICGKGDVWYEQVTFQQVKSGYLAVPSLPTKYGYILNKCTIVSDGTGSNDANGSYTLGRPWGKGTPIALYLNCVFNAVPSNEGWSEMSGGYPARFAEYNSVTANGTVIDLSKRKTIYDAYDAYDKDTKIYTNRRDEKNNPILTAAEASEYSIAKVMGDGDDWDPTAFTEQASAPQNVAIAGTTLSWDNSNYVFCWAVIKNGNIVDFTTTPSYTVDDKTATWSVRAANEMGGLGEATEATLATGINDINKVAKTSDAIFNIAGQKVSKSYKGIMIKNGKKYVK